MNIFVLDENPTLCAQAHCDKHVVKMILETTQILCTNLHELGMGDHAPYRATHKNHPCTVWARQSRDNWQWTWQLGVELYAEYKYRFYNRTHKSGEVLLALPTPTAMAYQCPDMTLRPQAMPDQYKQADAVLAYRDYYRHEKSDMLTYTKRAAPEWITNA